MSTADDPAVTLVVAEGAEAFAAARRLFEDARSLGYYDNPHENVTFMELAL